MQTSTQTRTYRIALALMVSLAACAGLLLAQDLSLTPSATGQADAPKGMDLTFGGLFLSGGPVMYPLLLASIIGMALVVDLSFFSLRKKKFTDMELLKSVNELVLNREYDKAVELCENSQPLIMKAFLAGLKKREHRKVDIESAIGEVLDNGISDVMQTNQYLNAVAVVAPMLGLLGTVTGMINAFNVIAFGGGMGKPELLAKGVGEALITTAAGLIIAIPFMVMYFYYRGVIRKLTIGLSVSASEFVDNLSYSKRGSGVQDVAA